MAAVPAAGTPELAEAEWSLISTIQETGTKVYNRCQYQGLQGAYISRERALVVCTDGRDPSEWTEAEKNTLRHEAVHLAQDCMGEHGDAELETVSKTATLLKVVADSKIDVDHIEADYRNRGVNDQGVLLELEAFAYARLLDAKGIERLVADACELQL